MELCNIPLSDLTELSPWVALTRATKKLGCVLRDKVIQEMVVMDRGQKKFTQLACGGQSAKYSNSQLSRILPGKGSSFTGYKTSFSSCFSKRGEGKMF